MSFQEVSESNFRTVVSGLKKDGWKLHRVSGAHHIFKHPDSKKLVIVPKHSKDIGPGILKSIKKQSSLSEDGGIVGTGSAIPAVNTQSTGEAEIAANPPVRKKKKLEFGLLQRSAPGQVPRKLRQIISKEK